MFLLKHGTKKMAMTTITVARSTVLITALACVTDGLMAAEAKQELITGGGKGSEFQLEVRQTPLAEVLKLIANKTGVPVHYSVLPEGLITATCVGPSLKKILECLVNHKADIIVRYSKTGIKAGGEAQIAEAWILGSKLEALPSAGFCAKPTEVGRVALTHSDNGENASKQDQSDILLNIAQSANPKDRAEAIGSLLSIGNKNDPKIKAMLEEAVHGQDAGVRAQAISTLTHRDDYRENAEPILREALHDDSVDVRLMAVDGITDEIDLLEQAVNDVDETVRSFAAQKLKEALENQKTK